MAPGREFNRWLLRPIADPSRPLFYAMEEPNSPSLLELLRRDAELPTIGRSRFSGTLAQRNKLWLSYRNFLRQALSNFKAALGVEDRSSSLLYYYAMLNFAKAELLRVHPSKVDGFVAHGLRFHGTGAKSVAGDYLTVLDGVFPLLYKLRTGVALPVGTRLPIPRLLATIPEIGEQVETVTKSVSSTSPVVQLIAIDDTAAWTIFGIGQRHRLTNNSVTARYFGRVFAPIDPPRDWRDRFAISRRWGAMDFFESRTKVPYNTGNDAERDHATNEAWRVAWSAKDILVAPSTGDWDGTIAPSLYRTRMLRMPPSLARYAVAYYASSLVRYRPAMFDSQIHPEYAYLFDAISRECAVPMLVDTLAALTGEQRIFLRDGAMRV
jgi:hypothetical protein